MSGLVDLPVPSEEGIHAQVARRLDVTAEQVRAALAEQDIRLASPLPARRSLCVHRLYCEGAKTGTDDNDGAFTVDYPLGAGPWAFASVHNSAGKSNLLWALTWALRGEGFDEYQRGDTVDWFHYIRVDAEVAGVPVSIRVTLTAPHGVRLELLTADALETLLALKGRDQYGDHVRSVAIAKDAAEAKELIGRFMCDRLGLRPLTVWTAEQGAPVEDDKTRDSTGQVHGWPSFFHAIALNAGHDKVLLGPVKFGALPVRLMQIFLDVPYVADLSEVSAAIKQRKQQHRHGERRQVEDRRAREARIEPVRHMLDEARRRLAELSADTPDLRKLLERVHDTARHLTTAISRRDELAEAWQQARKERIRAERALKWARESAAARTLLGALDPEICPRCETDIDDERREQENARHRCSVCTSPLAIAAEDPGEREQLLAGLEGDLKTLRGAETSARQAVDKADGELAAARDRQQQADLEFQKSTTSDWFAARQEAAAAVHRLEGAVELLERELDTSVAPADDEQELVDRVLLATEEELKAVFTQRSRELFQDVSTELVTLARRLGVTNLTGVDLKLNGSLNARKSGKKTPYDKFSPGERLRMRIAAVAAMITVGRRHGIASHPGLLLIDAPIAEEVVPGDAGMALEALRDLADTVDGLQLIITSMNDAIWEVFPKNRIYRNCAGPDDRYMF